MPVEWTETAVYATGLLGAMLAAVVSAGELAVPQGAGEGWARRHAGFNARAREGNADLVFLGDSWVEGWETAGKEAWARFYGDRQAVNFGIAGDGAERILWRVEHGNFEGLAPKLVVLMCDNDDETSTPEQLAEGVKPLVGKLRARLPKAKVLLLGLLPSGANPEDPKRQSLAQANQRLAQFADDKQVFFLDLGPRLLDLEGRRPPEFWADEKRLTPRGYEICAEWLDQRVTTLMGALENPLLPAPLDPPGWNGAWLKRHESFNERARQGGVDLIFIGDSITNGWINEGKRVWETYYGKRNAVNLGISTDRIQNVLWRLDHGNVDGISPKLAVVMIGTNNSSRSKPELIPAGIKAVVERLRAKLPQTKILLLAIFPRGADSQDRWRLVNDKVNAEIAQFADDERVYFLDIGPKLLAPDGTASKDILRDLLHLSEKGYEIWAASIEPLVAKLMGER
ncbi:MAG: GDSL-type esterase/lipase family protein [Planctomycetota bacterium]|nr:GDSL-type esterase/lipase family protein [Planctomycetota bacterium]